MLTREPDWLKFSLNSARIMTALTETQLEIALKNRRGLVAVSVPDGVVVVSPQGAENEPGGAVRFEDARERWTTVAGLRGTWNGVGGARGGRLWLWSREGHEWQSLSLKTWEPHSVPDRRASERKGVAVVLSADGPMVLGREPHRWTGADWEPLPALPEGSGAAVRAVALRGGEVVALCSSAHGWSAARLSAGAREWRPIAGAPRTLGWPTLTRLPDESVLVLSGPAKDMPGLPDRGAWRYDPAGDTWAELAPVPLPLQSHAVVRLSGGRLLVDADAGAAVFDPSRASWDLVPGVSERIGAASVAALPRDRVLVVGGVGRDSAWEIIDCSREAVAAAQRLESETRGEA